MREGTVRYGRYWIVVEIHDQQVGGGDTFGREIGQHIVADYDTVPEATRLIRDIQKLVATLAAMDTVEAKPEPAEASAS